MRWRIFARMRRFFWPTLRRPLPDFFVPKIYSLVLEIANEPVTQIGIGPTTWFSDSNCQTRTFRAVQSRKSAYGECRIVPLSQGIEQAGKQGGTMFLGSSQTFRVAGGRSRCCALCVLACCRKDSFAPRASGEAQRCSLWGQARIFGLL